MPNLRDILYGVNIVEVHGSTDIEIKSIGFDSRNINSDDVFIATKGTQVDGHQFINQTIQNGVSAIVCEDLPSYISKDITFIKVQDSSKALAIMACNFFDNPSQKLHLVAITGTNGKTTLATLLYKLFRSLGYKVGLLSTVANKINDSVIKATHTTPDAIQINQLLNDMVEAGCEYCFMEASSHAIDQNRIAGLKLSGAVFTNITHDHLDYHKTFDAYIAAKKKLFDNLSSGSFALSNIDDKRGLVMLQNTKSKKYTYALKSPSDFNAKILENSFLGLTLNINNHEVHTTLIGQFNAYNTLAVYATAILLKQDEIEVLQAISSITGAEGRFEHTTSPNDKVIGVVDYAHTPDALKNIIDTINDIKSGNSRLITVIGCGGDRDTSKRPIMGEIASKNSNQTIFTSDNPRSENPENIIQDMIKGVGPVEMKKVLSITDRKEAIKTACTLAQKEDVVLIAGKGHETYQEINGVKHPFDDKEVLEETFKMLNK